MNNINLLKEKIESIRIQPGAYYDAVISDIEYHQKQNSIEDLLCIMFAGASRMYPELFERLSQQILENDSFQGNIEYQYYYYTTRGSFFRYIHELKFALDCFEKANTLSFQLNDPDRILRSFIYISTIYSESGDYEMALHYSEQGFNNFNTVKDSSIKTDFLNTFGMNLYYLKDYRRSISVYKKAIEYYRQIPSYESYINYCICTLNLGDILTHAGEETDAEKYFSEGIKLAEKYNHYDLLITGLISISDFYFKKGDLNKAYQFQKRFVQHTVEANKARKKIELSYDKHRMKEEITTLNILKNQNENLTRRLDNLYSLIKEADETQLKRTNIMKELDLAIRNGEIQTFYQLQWSLEQNKFIGAEALARWVKSDGTVISPDLFIGLIEETDLISALSLQVIRQSFSLCKQITEKIDDNFVMSINIAPYQLTHDDISEILEREILYSGISSKNVEVEITERTFIDNNPKARKQLQALSDLNIKIALDDFGTGFSSLSCVNSLPLSTIKIDQSLLWDAEKEVRNATLLSSIIHLMKELNFQIVVEGVETESHVSILKGLGCHITQGYYYSRPAKREEILKVLEI